MFVQAAVRAGLWCVYVCADIKMKVHIGITGNVYKGTYVECNRDCPGFCRGFSSFLYVSLPLSSEYLFSVLCQKYGSDCMLKCAFISKAYTLVSPLKLMGLEGFNSIKDCN